MRDRTFSVVAAKILAIAASLTVGALNLPRLIAQSPTPAAGPAFEIASVKPNKSGEVLNSIAFQQGGRLSATNVPLRELIRVAFGIQSFQLLGGPSWIGSERFDIVAKAEGDPPSGPMPLMIRRLLTERFKLVVHSEARKFSVYALVMARSDGRLGPQLRASQVNCAVATATARARVGAVGLSQPDQPQLCDMFIGFAPRFLAGGVSMEQLATSLSRQVDRVVVDRTALSGTFDFDLQWTPEGLPRRPTDAGAGPVRLNGVDIDPNGPSIFTSLQEQLGLKLDPQDGPVDVIVIDSASLPTPD